MSDEHTEQPHGEQDQRRVELVAVLAHASAHGDEERAIALAQELWSASDEQLQQIARSLCLLHSPLLKMHPRSSVGELPIPWRTVVQ